MKKVLISLMAVLALTSCKFVSVSPGKLSMNAVVLKGDTVVDTLDLKDFHAITVKGQGDLDFIQSEDYLVILNATEGVLEYLDCRVNGGELILSTRDHVQLRASDYHYTIYAPELSSIVIKGAADLNMRNYCSGRNLKVEVNGAGDIDLDNVKVPTLEVEVNGAGDIDCEAIDVEELKVEVNGAGDAKLSGRATNADFSLSGAGDIDARNLKTENVTKSKRGVGSIRI